MQPDPSVEQHLRSLVQTFLTSEMAMRRERDRLRLDLAAVCFAAAAVVKAHDELGQAPRESIEQLRATIERVGA